MRELTKPDTEVQYFKSTKESNRYKKGQKIWIRLNCANHLYTYHKWKGFGRYTEGVIDKFSPLVGSIETIIVSKYFANKIHDTNQS